MTTLRLLVGLLVSAITRGAPWSQGPAPQARPQAKSCQPCHQTIVASFTQTAHFLTSAIATAKSVKADFPDGPTVLRTRAEGVYFLIERRNGAAWETGVDSAHGTTRTERLDLVVGSGRRGQSYLYWSNERLFELPVSYLTQSHQWINSPGYPDGQVDFGRLIVPRCLECHSTSFQLRMDRGTLRYSRDYVPGISCERCHGDGRAHVSYYASHPPDTLGHAILNPALFSRDRQVDVCALCHSGGRDPRRPPFLYRPGERLDDYYAPPSDDKRASADVHGNQVGLLERSLCFRSSPLMSCSTCHDVHQPQRDLTWFAQKCLHCHETTRHPMADQIGGRMMADCIDCHMPNRKSRAIEINTPTKRVALYFRSHAIGIYPDVAAAVLRSSRETERR